MDDDIQETVESLLGKDIKIVDCEKKSNVQEEEVLLVNGFPITLNCENGQAIKNSLLQGNIPDCELLNDILIKAGILKSSVQLETSLSVKSSITTKEEVTVAKGGQIVDGRSRETKENNLYTSETSEIWEPVGVFPSNTYNKHPVITTPSSDYNTSFSSCSSSDLNSNRNPNENLTKSSCSYNLPSAKSLFKTKQNQYSSDSSSLPSSVSSSATGNTFNIKQSPASKVGHSATTNIGSLKYKDTAIMSVTETPLLSSSSLSSSSSSSSLRGSSSFSTNV